MTARYHDRNDENYCGPHHAPAAVSDMNCAHPARRQGCRMNGFAVTSEQGRNCDSTNPLCSGCNVTATTRCPDVMGYHTGSEIPNYWRYARDFALQDHMLEPVRSWSLPEHLFSPYARRGYIDHHILSFDARTTGSSRTTSSIAIGSTRERTAGRTRDLTCGRQIRH